MPSLLIICLFLIVFSFFPTGSSRRECDSDECILYDLSSQSSCVYESHDPTYISTWYAGLDSNIDTQLAGGKIAAYRILWSGGFWSTWFVPGVNDLDWKFNTDTMFPRRVWSYFYDHTHEYIICRSPTPEPTLKPTVPKPSAKPSRLPTAKPTPRKPTAKPTAPKPTAKSMVANGVSTDTTSSTTTDSSGLSETAIAWIVIGSVAAVVLAIVLYFFLSRFQRAPKQSSLPALNPLQAEEENYPM
eukprot:gene12551-13739_t